MSAPPPGAPAGPPPGPTDSRGTYINSSIWVLQGLAGVFLALRVYCKFIRRRGFWWDDYLLIAGWVRTVMPGMIQPQLGYYADTSCPSSSCSSSAPSPPPEM